MDVHALTIADKIIENQEVFTLSLNQPMPALPGQFNMLHVFGVGESAISFSHITSQGFAHTIRAVGQVTRALQRLEPNQTITLRGPFGTPWPLEACKDHPLLLIAGGIGLAPLKPVIESLIEHQHQKVTLIYGARTPDDLIFQEDLIRWQNSLEVLLTVDHPTQDWPYHVGVVTPFIDKVIKHPKNTRVFMCGPEVMMRFSVRSLLEAGVSCQRIWLSMERSMQCGFGQCGHCQWGPYFICKDGPVMNYAKINSFFTKHEL